MFRSKTKSSGKASSDPKASSDAGSARVPSRADLAAERPRSTAYRTGPLARNDRLNGASSGLAHAYAQPNGGGGVTDHLDPNADRRAQRHPDSQMGLAHLLEVYDQHPGLVATLDATKASLAEAEEAVVVAERDRDQALHSYSAEQEARKRDAEQARKDKASALQERESKIRGELQPQIDTLTAQLREMTADRDTLRTELSDYRTRAGKWADEVERLGKERRDVEEAERKAAEGRKTIAERLEGLEKGVLEGLRDVAEGKKVPTEKKDQGEKRDNVGGKKFVEGDEEEKKPRARPRDNPWA